MSGAERGEVIGQNSQPRKGLLIASVMRDTLVEFVVSFSCFEDILNVHKQMEALVA